MKKFNLTLATMILVFGFVLVGSDAETIQLQFVACMVGYSFMFGGGYWATRILRRKS